MENHSPIEATANTQQTRYNTTESAHRIGVLMSQTGRFLECMKCHLNYEFPAGALYDEIAKQFELHMCKNGDREES